MLVSPLTPAGQAPFQKKTYFFRKNACEWRGGPHSQAVPELHTTFEGDFGGVAGDVLYLHGLRDRRPRHRVLVFPR